MNLSKQNLHFNKGNKDGNLEITTTAIVCPNNDCREYTISASLRLVVEPQYRQHDKTLLEWQLKPNSLAKQFPPEIKIPKPIIADYEEACLISELSPKASATLARRCLQGMIRNFFNVNKNRLIDEINAIEHKVDPQVWEAINAVRKIGNIGAHMEQNINLIIDIEPQEAKCLIELIETLIKEWYIGRYERNKRLDRINNLAEDKEKKKQSPENGVAR